jgi:hypothetical protein
LRNHGRVTLDPLTVQVAAGQLLPTLARDRHATVAASVVVSSCRLLNVANDLRIQLIDATVWSNLSAGVS